VPERRSGLGRRAGEDKPKQVEHRVAERRTATVATTPDNRKAGRRAGDPEPPRPEVEPDRRHLLHKTIGGKKR
jgi:hypothetical protein